MTDSDTPAPDPDQLPKHTTPTWEVELLISGVAVFAMLQLPGWLDSQFFALTPRLSTDLAGLALVLYIYLKTTAVILAVTFALHLLLRAQWIALVGMHSVYPDGVRWPKLRMGPMKREVEQRLHGHATVSIERADNRATVVFAIGVMLATLLLLISVVFATLFGLFLLGATLIGIHVGIFLLLTLCVAPIMLLLLAAEGIDRIFGERLREGSWLRRVLAATFRVLARSGIGRRSEVMALLASHGNERRINLMIGITFAVLFMAVLLGLSSMKAPARAGSYALFPSDADNTRTLSSAYYDDQRDPLHGPAVPFVQSAVIDGNYLRLTVPYQPQHDAPALQRDCPTALVLPEGDARGNALLDCLTRLHAVSLDGQPLPSLRYAASSDPRTDRPALQAMIDVRALASGHHLLRVERTATAIDDSSTDRDDAYVIAFWR